MRIAIIGAFGQTGPALIEYLSDDEYELTCVDVTNHPDHEMTVADATSYDEMVEVLEGHDAVVHLARASYNSDNDLDGFFKNLQMCHAVLAAARDVEIETVVFASTNHVVGTYEEAFSPEIYYPGHGVTIDHTDPIRPDSLYAVGKACGEALGRFTVEHTEYPERFFALRIGTVRSKELDHPYCMAEEGVNRGDWERGSDEYSEMAARVKATWQSRHDFAHMVDCCLQTPEPGFDIFYGVSDNDRRWLDIDHARETIGYAPRDNGEEWASPPGRS